MRPSSIGCRKRFEHAPIELRHLVEKQHAAMGEAHFAGPRRRSAADQRDVRDGVMRRAERPLLEQPNAGPQLPGHRMNGRDLDRFLERQRRQDARQPSRQHRLAGAGRTDHQQVVAAGGGHFQRASRERLTVKVGQIEWAASVASRAWCRGAEAAWRRRGVGQSLRSA